jgi:oligopeptide/dipeptide ABC transporter ATP-binding protein
MKPILDIKDLSIAFHTYRGVMEAVHRVSIFVDAGETIGIVGESGCGKSVTAQAVMQLLPKDNTIYAGGTIHWRDRDVLALDDRQMDKLRGKEMAMVFQDPMTSLNPVLTIGDQVCEGMIHHSGLSRKEAQQKALSLLQAVGLTSPEKRFAQFPHELSGGMRQRCLIATALACSPKLIFADEPTTALDVTTEAQVLTLLRSLQKEMGMAIVLISHNLGIIAQMCHRVYVMYAGCVVEEGTVADIFDASVHPYTQGLLASLPDPNNKDKALTGIAGQAPDLFHVPDGCRFYPRCHKAMRICMREEPPVYDLGNNHRAACWLLCPEREAKK